MFTFTYTEKASPMGNVWCQFLESGCVLYTGDTIDLFDLHLEGQGDISHYLCLFYTSD